MSRVRLIVTHGVGSQVPGSGWDHTLVQRVVASLASRNVACDVQLAAWGDEIDTQLATPRSTLQARGVQFSKFRTALWTHAGDALVYGGDYAVRERIRRAMRHTIYESTLPAVVVAHSWGTVVASDALCRVPSSLHGMEPRLAFVSFGSPLAVTGIENPVPPLDAWTNLYDPLDPIGSPLNGLRGITCHDIAVTTTPWYQRMRPVAGPILAHTSYWKSPVVADAVVRAALRVLA